MKSRKRLLIEALERARAANYFGSDLAHDLGVLRNRGSGRLPRRFERIEAELRAAGFWREG